MIFSEKKSIAQKISAFVCAFAIVVTATYVPVASIQKPVPAHAFLGVGDIVVDPTNLVQNTVSAAADVDSLIVSKILNGLAWTVAKTAVQSITRSLVNWINSGFRGSPAFVTDLERNLRDVGDAVAEDFFDNLNTVVENETGFNIRTPFQDQIAQRIRDEYYRSTGALLSQRGYCDIDRVSTNPEAFQRGDFSQGGFNAYFKQTQNERCNPFGEYLSATNALTKRISSKERSRRSELDWGKGFLSWRGDCKASVPSAGPGPITLDDTSLNTSDKCLEYEIKTPGSVIEDQLAHSLGSGVRQLELADSINEIVAALAGQLVNQVIGGIGGLSGVSAPTSGGGRSIIDRATDSSSYDSTVRNLGQGFDESIQNTINNTEDYREAWGIIKETASLAVQSCSSRSSELSQAQQVLDRATAEVTRADGAISSLENFSSRIRAATATDSINSATNVSSITSEYQTFLSSNKVPSVAEVSSAEFESGDSGSASAKTLFTQMTELRRSCSALRL